VASVASNGGGADLRVAAGSSDPGHISSVVSYAPYFLFFSFSFVSSKQICNISCSYNFSLKFSHVDFFAQFSSITQV
jgi:hypothetical protein